jgi:hypothetical protein
MLWRIEHGGQTYWSRQRPEPPAGSLPVHNDPDYIRAAVDGDEWAWVAMLFTPDDMTESLRVRNLTPHPLVLVQRAWSDDIDREYEWPVVIAPSGVVARVTMEREPVTRLAVSEETSIPVVRTTAGHAEGLPEPGDVPLIVSRQVAEACPDRGDLFVVDETVRDITDGSVIGFRALASLARPEALEAFLRLRDQRQANHIVRRV